MRHINEGEKMKLGYAFLLLIPGITFGQIMEDFLVDHFKEDMTSFCENGFIKACLDMKESESADQFFFHKGKCYAFAEILNEIQAD